jgi:hypothetical protein
LTYAICSKKVIVADLCQLDGSLTGILVVKAIQRSPKDDQGLKTFTTSEVDWFCKNAYNIGLKYVDAWPLRLLIRLFDSCLGLTQLYPSDMPAEHTADLSLKRMLCHFIVAAALTAAARAEDNLAQQLQDYLVMRPHVAAFDDEFRHCSGGLGERMLGDLKAKFSTMMLFDFEGAVHLKKWDELGEIVRKATTCEDEAAFKKMADCLLRQSDVPSQRKLVVETRLVGRDR